MHPLPLLAATLISASAVVPPALARYLDAARRHNPDLAVARAQADQARARTRQALGAMLPAVTLRGAYTRNQYSSEAIFPAGPGAAPQQIVITPRNQLDASVGLTTTLFDWQQLQRYSGERQATEAARLSADATAASVALSVAQVYYQVVAGQGLVAAARRSVEAARQNLELAQVRFDAGSATSLDLERARVDIARAEQNLSSARRALALSRRSLASLTGEPEPGDLPEPEELPAVEESEQRYAELAVARREELAGQRALVRQAEALQSAAWGALLPSANATAYERWTNAEGFVGRRTVWIAGVVLDWRVGVLGTRAAIEEGAARLREQRAALTRTELQVKDEVHRAWLDVQTNRSRLEQARVELSSAREALELARARYRAGAATSFELSQIQTDAFVAEANLVQARTDLAFSLLALRRSAGEPLD